MLGTGTGKILSCRQLFQLVLEPASHSVLLSKWWDGVWLGAVSGLLSTGQGSVSRSDWGGPSPSILSNGSGLTHVLMVPGVSNGGVWT